MISLYGIPGVPPSKRVAALLKSYALSRRATMGAKIKALVIRVSDVSEKELAAGGKRTTHRIALARMMLANHAYKDAGCSLKEIGKLIRPEKPLDHASVIYYNKKFLELESVKDPGFMVLLTSFLLEYQPILDSFTTINPTTT